MTLVLLPSPIHLEMEKTLVQSNLVYLTSSITAKILEDPESSEYCDIHFSVKVRGVLYISLQVKQMST